MSTKRLQFEYFGKPSEESVYWMRILKNISSNKGTFITHVPVSGFLSFCWASFPDERTASIALKELEEMESVGLVEFN